ncbi:MAG: hypothetical protein KKD11_05285 [Candidatus Omnitrophica bacterium]|nr:hypothetical protein [Candidatus Omnitrophota bacterium]
MRFDDFYFKKFKFSQDQINQNIENASKDLAIAKKDAILDVKFNYAYTAFIKVGIALLSSHHVKIKSVPGHHVKIIEKMAEILKDENILSTGNAMRSKRNMDFYGGGIEVTEKECKGYIRFVDEVFTKVKNTLVF